MADDEPSVLINYERESIHAGDDPIPLTIEFPARVTITDLRDLRRAPKQVLRVPEGQEYVVLTATLVRNFTPISYNQSC